MEGQVSDETPTVLCVACRYPVPVGGVVGFAVPVPCPRCATILAVDANGTDAFRVRLGPENGGLTPRGTTFARPGSAEAATRRLADAPGGTDK